MDSTQNRRLPLSSSQHPTLARASLLSLSHPALRLHERAGRCEWISQTHGRRETGDDDYDGAGDLLGQARTDLAGA